MFNRLRRLWHLSKKEPKELEILESLTPDQLAEVPEVVDGDGKAEFLGEGTHEEFVEQERADSGIRGWYERMKRM